MVFWTRLILVWIFSNNIINNIPIYCWKTEIVHNILLLSNRFYRTRKFWFDTKVQRLFISSLSLNEKCILQKVLSDNLLQKCKIYFLILISLYIIRERGHTKKIKYLWMQNLITFPVWYIRDFTHWISVLYQMSKF